MAGRRNCHSEASAISGFQQKCGSLCWQQIGIWISRRMWPEAFRSQSWAQGLSPRTQAVWPCLCYFQKPPFLYLYNINVKNHSSRLVSKWPHRTWLINERYYCLCFEEESLLIKFFQPEKYHIQYCWFSGSQKTYTYFTN